MARFKSGIVVSAHPLASKIGVNILRKGGNAVDAAVATVLGLGVVAPAFCGIGGGGFALIWLAQEEKALFVDYRERAPHAAKEDMFQLSSSGKVVRDENSVGYKAVGVPGAIAGHSLMLEKFGRMNFREVYEPAISHAQKGFEITRALAYAWKQNASKLGQFESSSAAYMRNGKPYREGNKLTPKDLAKSYSAIAHNGPGEFYNGKIARQITEDMAAHEGLVSVKDLENYKPTIREPIRGSYKELEVISAPPPSSGGPIILQTLNMLENYPLKDYGHNSTRALHIISETLGRGFINCRAHVCDPDFTTVQLDKLVSKDFANALASSIRLDTASLPLGPANLPSMSSSSTSHLVTIDSEHNVVSMTESVECYFGSGVVVPGTGIILNDTIHDFDPNPNQPNSVEPWKVPMSSMSPTIVLKNGKPIMALGSAGATRIVSSTLQAFLNIAEFGIPIKDAVAAPRLHIQKNQIQLENGITRKSAANLRRMGHEVTAKRGGMYFGGVHAAIINPDNTLEGAPDPRRDGSAMGT